MEWGDGGVAPSPLQPMVCWPRQKGRRQRFNPRQLECHEEPPPPTSVIEPTGTDRQVNSATTLADRRVDGATTPIGVLVEVPSNGQPSEESALAEDPAGDCRYSADWDGPRPRPLISHSTGFPTFVCVPLEGCCLEISAQYHETGWTLSLVPASTVDGEGTRGSNAAKPRVEVPARAKKRAGWRPVVNGQPETTEEPRDKRVACLPSYHTAPCHPVGPAWQLQQPTPTITQKPNGYTYGPHQLSGNDRGSAAVHQQTTDFEPNRDPGERTTRRCQHATCHRQNHHCQADLSGTFHLNQPPAWRPPGGAVEGIPGPVQLGERTKSTTGSRVVISLGSRQLGDS